MRNFRVELRMMNGTTLYTDRTVERTAGKNHDTGVLIDALCSDPRIDKIISIKEQESISLK